jgi:chromosome partitioning protein
MPKLVVALINRKGGTGKTTSAGYLAQIFYQRGHAVSGLDLDPDQSWLKWYRSGVLPYEVISGDRDDLHDQVASISSEMIVIDTPPNDEGVVFKAAGIADEVIIPLAPTTFDVGRLVTTMKNVADVERMRGRPLASILLTRWQPNLKVTQEVVALLQERKAPLLNSRIRQLTRYTEFTTPNYLDEYEAVLKELEVL